MDSQHTNLLATASANNHLQDSQEKTDLTKLASQSESLQTSNQVILSSIESRVSFLEKLLAGKLSRLEIPAEKNRAKVKEFASNNQSWQLPQELSESLKYISCEQKLSLFALLLTTFQILLYRYTNQTEVIIGTPVKQNQKLIEEQSFDIFKDIILLPLQLSPEQNFVELAQTLQLTFDTQKKRDLVINTEIAKVLCQNSNNLAFFQVMFELENNNEEIPINSNWEFLNLDLMLKVVEQPEGLLCRFTYNSNLFASAQIARMMQHFQVLLEGVVANPEQAIASLELLTACEKQQILIDWNNTQADYPSNQCIHQLFEQQVAKTPEAIALIFEKQQLTYQELNQRANVLAHYLQELGVKPDTLVGICVERSLEMIIGILATLKAGGAYVPLDPNYPIERIGYKLEDSQVKVLLTQQSLNLDELIHKFPQQKTQIITFEEFTAKIAFEKQQENQQNLTSPVTANNLAYVIYTSGSTGKPKGVQIEHRTAVNLLTAIARSPGLEAKDTLLSVTTISFDIAVLETFLPLIVGAKLVIVSRQTAMDGHQLIQALEKHQATLLQSTPITWKILLAAGWQGSNKLKMFTGGEALSKELAKQLENKGASLWNLYGPTEATIWSSVHQVQANQESISIGRPLANVKYYILDANLMPLPVGIPGELYIGGDCLSRGYLNRPELTAERFIADPFSEQPGARIYKTGDLACYFADGTVNCLGRLDRQVKIRGFRIEIEEIETVILEYLGVQATAVIVQENSSGYQRLVGYLVNQPNCNVDHEALRSFLQQKLPAHMVPFGFMNLNALPLTPNGKIDPKALPRIEFVNQSVSQNYLAPRSELENQLALIWSKVLEVQPIGIKDDFLELGGTSLLAMDLVKEVELTLQQKMPLNALANLSTVEQMAQCFVERQSIVEDLATTLDGINPQEYQALLTIMAGRKGDRPRPNSLMVAMQNQGHQAPFFFCANAYHEAEGLADYLGKTRPFYLMESGYFTLECNARQIKALATQHLEDILTVQPQAPYLLGGYSTGGIIAWEIAQQLKARGKEVALLVLFDTAGPAGNYEKYEKLSYTLQTQLDKLAKMRMMEKLSYLKQKMTEKPPTGNSASEPYIIQPYQDKVLLFLANEAERASFFNHKIKFALFPRIGWHPDMLPQLTIERIPGNHLSMLEMPNVRVLGAKLKEYLE